MLKSKQEVADAVTKLCRKELRDIDYKKNLHIITSDLEKKHNISIAESNDLLSLRTDPIDASEFMLFCIIQKLNEKKLNDYFTDIEIKEFSDMKLEQKKIKFPLSYNVIQVTDTQWIGSMSVKELMTLYDAQLIRYNENAQRTLKRMISGSVEYFKININRSAVNAIIDSYKKDLYIPNTITLNIPETTDFYYKDKQLIIKELDTFDVLDGYHRLIAISNMHILDPDFDYPMEIRFVSFGEDQAKQFIWQEDQKTKMSRVDSESFNQNNYGNQIISMIDQVTTLKGIINRNGVLPAGYVSAMINILWFNKAKQYNRKEIILVKDTIKDNLLEFIDTYPDLFEKHWAHQQIMTLFFLIYKKDMENFEAFNNFIKANDFKAMRNFTKPELNAIEGIYKKFKGKNK